MEGCKKRSASRVHIRTFTLQHFLNDIFIFIDKVNIANYADDNTTNFVEENINCLLNTLENETNTILKWFQINEMKANNDKCHLIVTIPNQVSVTSGEQKISNCSSVNLLGVCIDKRLTFSDHVLKLCKKGN